MSFIGKRLKFLGGQGCIQEMSSEQHETNKSQVKSTEGIYSKNPTLKLDLDLYVVDDNKNKTHPDLNTFDLNTDTAFSLNTILINPGQIKFYFFLLTRSPLTLLLASFTDICYTQFTQIN